MRLLRFIFSVVLILTGLTVRGQDVTIQLFQPSNRNAMLPELYRANIMNNSGADLQCYLVLTATEDEDGLVGIIESAVFDVPEGAKQLNANNYQQLEPVETRQVKEEYKEFTLRTNTLPPGNYEICLAIYNEATGDLLDEDCYRLQSASINPPYLLSPQNKSVVTEEFPFFSWSPATPSPQSGSYAYTLLITEMHGGQSPVAAIQSNPPWLLRKNLLRPSFNIQLPHAPLKKEKRYAWQVLAFQNGNKIASSEVWAFIYRGSSSGSSDTSQEEEQVDILPPTYHSLSKDPDGGYRLLNEPVLRFTYDNPYGAEHVEVDLLDMKGNVIARNVLTKKQQPGINLNTLNTSGTGVQREKLYKLKLINGQGETYTMNFKIRKLEISKEDLQNIELPGVNQ